MLRNRKTGGGVGTNQYKVRGRAKNTSDPATIEVPQILRIQTVEGHDIPGIGPAIYPETTETRQAQATVLTKRQWRHLSQSSNTDVQLLLARRPDCPPKVFERLTSDHADYQARVGALSNPACPVDRLHYWSSTDSPATAREAIASNPNCPDDILDQLATDNWSMVRRAVASNLHCSPKAAEFLANNSDDIAAILLASNPSCPPDLLVRMATDPRRPALRQAVRNNPALPDFVRAVIALG